MTPPIVNDWQRQLDRKLQCKQIKIVSFDIFDTLVFRKVSDPTEIYRMVGDKACDLGLISLPGDNFRQLRIFAEIKARNNAVDREVDLTEIYNCIALPDDIRRELKKLEIETEKSQNFANRLADDWIDRAISAGKTVVCLSDMYFNKREVSDVAISKLSNAHLISDIWMSSEHKASKWSGELFKTFLIHQTLSPKNVLHIGDNNTADVKIPMSLGINTLKFSRDDADEKTVQHKSTLDYSPGDNLLRRDIAQNRKAGIEFIEEFGFETMGPVMFAFCRWLTKECRQHNIHRLLAITREGAFFKDVMEK